MMEKPAAPALLLGVVAVPMRTANVGHVNQGSLFGTKKAASSPVDPNPFGKIA